VSQPGPLPYLRFCDLEIANAARTIEYLRRGLGNTMQGHWELGGGELCSILYRTDGLAAGCGEASFVSPSADPAPWYDADEPGSSTFLGVVLLDLDGYDSTITRGVTQRINSLGGGVFTGQHRTPRTWKFRAALISADDAGAEYGLRWLTAVLQASACDTCSTCDLAVRLVCPPGDCSDDNRGKWISYDVALVEGPKEVQPRSPGSPIDTLAGCRDLVVVEWTMVAGNPFLYKPAQTADYFTFTQDAECTDICDFLFGSSTPECVAVDAPVRGAVGSIFTLETVDGFGSVVMEGYIDCGSSLNPTGTADLQITLTEVPAASTVIVDSAQHKITVETVDPVTSEVETGDGTYLVSLAANKAIEWLEVRDCDDIACFCIRAASPCAPGTLDVTIETQIREG
jgi:hypothetical protein